jgi:hypothetical protein
MKTISEFQRERAAERRMARIREVLRYAFWIAATVVISLAIGHIATKAMANIAHTIVHAEEGSPW